MNRSFVIACSAIAVLAALPAEAQQQQGRSARPPAARSAPAAPATPAKPAEPPPAPEPPPPPYEKELLRLSEIVGSLAFLLESEGTTPGRRERLAGAYNRGYRGYALTYRTCTASATEATARYLKEGETLSRNLAGRFGG